MRHTWPLLPLIVVLHIAHADPIAVRLFDADQSGGQSFGRSGISECLRDPGLGLQTITDLTPQTLAGANVLVLPDVHKLGDIADGWQQAVRAFTDAGGGVLLTHDCAGLLPAELFPDLLGVGKRHVSRSIDGLGAHVLTYGLAPFEHAFGDHRDLAPGPNAQVALTCSEGRPVVVVGRWGRGSVVQIGLCLGLDGMAKDAAVTGEEARLLLNAVLWLGGQKPWGADRAPVVRAWLPVPPAGQPEPVTVGLGMSWPEGGASAEVTLSLARGQAAVQRTCQLTGSKPGGPDQCGRVAKAEALPTAGLPDGDYALSVRVGGQEIASMPVSLAGEAQAADRERSARMAQRHRGSVIKFEFNQGYEYRKDPSKLAPYMKRIREQGCTAYDCMPASLESPWDEESLDWLERVCVAAQSEGLSVWATLVPPSESETIRGMKREEAQAYYCRTVEAFARLSLEHPNLVGYTCDDFSNDLGFFTPELLATMVGRQRELAPELAFMPLLYRPGITPSFRERYGPYVDGIVFHFRAESDPASYIPGYDPKSFDMYAEVMRQEFSRVREVMGDKTVLAGIYIWYYKGGWGVMTQDGGNPDEAHIVRDAVQKADIAHQYADGIRIYGLGIDHPAYTGMGEHFRRWQESQDAWGQTPPAPASRGAGVRAPEPDVAPSPYLGTLVDRPGSLLNALASTTRWPRVELRELLVQGGFDPQDAVAAFPVILLSRSGLRRPWAEALLQYARAGGLLLLEEVPGWRLDLTGDAPAEGERTDGDDGLLTRAFAAASGISFHYEPRGFVNRWRVTAQHPLTEGLGDGGAWVDVPFAQGGNTYPRLAYNVAATDGQVLLEAEEERCPYDGVRYVRKGETLGVRPLLTVATLGTGHVVRHYAHVSLADAMGQEAFAKLLANLVTWAERRR